MFEHLKELALGAFTLKSPINNSVEKHYSGCDPTKPKTLLAQKATGALIGEAIAKDQLKEATNLLLCVTREVVDRAVHQLRAEQVQKTLNGGHDETLGP